MHRTTKILALSGAAALFTFGFVAARPITDRPGERALALVPQTAKALVVVDLNPSASQILTFKQIEESLGASGFDQLASQVLKPFNLPPKIGASLTAHMGRGALVALQSLDFKAPLVFISVDNPSQLDTEFSNAIYPKFYKGVKYFGLASKSPGVGSFIGDYFVIAEKPEDLVPVKRISLGLDKPIIADSRFTSAWSHRPDATNVSVMFDPAGAMGEWAALNVGLGSEGLQFSLAGKGDMNDSTIARLASIASFDQPTISKIPGNPYLAIGISQLTTLVGEELTKALPPTDADALKGRMLVGLYPHDAATSTGLDLIAVMDDANGADTSTMLTEGAKKLGETLKQQPDGTTVDPMETSTYRSATITKISKKVANDFLDGIKSVAKAEQKSEEASITKALNVEKLLEDKTLCMAQIGKVGIVSTSENLLKKTVDGYLDKSANASWIVNQQVGVKIDLAQIAKMMGAEVDKAKLPKKELEAFTQVMEALSAMPGSVQIGGAIHKDGRFSLTGAWPMDYARVFKVRK